MGKEKYFVEEHPKYAALYRITQGNKKTIGTKNLIKGDNVYGEKTFAMMNDEECREWNPHRSKLCAYLHKNGKEFHLKAGQAVLYLGAANGTTVSHFSDINKDGRIYSIEFSARSIRELIQRLEHRQNVIPILEDATQPQKYRSLIPEQVDIVYQDVAQPDQAKILLKNMRIFLKKGGIFYIAIKARSIDVSQDPQVVFQREREILENNGCNILEMKDISPYSDDHVMIVGKYD